MTPLATHTTNPFHPADDPDRHHIWHRLITVDTEAFIASDWSMIEEDFDPTSFEGIRCANSTDPDDWRIVFPNLSDYRDAWLAASHEFLKKSFAEVSHREAVYLRCRLTQIDITGHCALAHKKFSASLTYADGTTLTGNRQTIYRLRKFNQQWKIVGFLGFLPL